MKAIILFLHNRYFHKLFTKIAVPIFTKNLKIMTCVNLFNYVQCYSPNRVNDSGDVMLVSSWVDHGFKT